MTKIEKELRSRRADNATKSFRVAVILDTIPVGGPGKGVIQFVRSLRELQNAPDITIYNFSYPNRGRQYFNELARTHGLNLRTIEQSGRLDWAFIKTLRQEFEETGVEVVQTHSFKPHLVGWQIRRKTGIPWLAFAHGWTAQSRRVHIYNALEKRLLPKSDYCCTVTTKLRDEFIAYGRAPDRIEVVPNAVKIPDSNTSRSSAEARNELGLRDDALILCCIGRFSREKGQDILLDAISTLRPDHADFQLVFAGDGPDMESARQSVRDHGLEDRVVFLGHLVDVSKVYLASDLLVLPSRSEGVPNVVLEAFSRCVPVVATPVGALPEMISESGAGWLSKEANSTELRHTLNEAMSDLSALRSAGQHGLSYVRKSFNPDARRQQILDVYRRLLSADKPMDRDD